MRILFLSFYFRPDLGPGAIRATPLVEALHNVMPRGGHIDVVTTLPNRYQSFIPEAPEDEQEDGVSIYRVKLPKHRSGMIDQSLGFLIFARAAIRYVAKRDYDMVVATSSRLMTAVLSAWIAWRKKLKLYLDIRDIFVDMIDDLFSRKISLVIRPIFSKLEKWAIKKAVKVNLVSYGFSGYFKGRYPEKEFSYFTNGIDNEFLSISHASSSHISRNGLPCKVLYAGNVGDGQGLHLIIPQIAKLMGNCIQFEVIGDGGRIEELRGSLQNNNIKNVELLRPVARHELIKHYLSTDVLFLHLNDYEAFKKVLPSKLFEYAALGKPIWAGIAGYSADFVRSEIVNAAVFSPCDAKGAVQVFETLNLQVVPRTDFVSKYSRANISLRMAEDILKNIT